MFQPLLAEEVTAVEVSTGTDKVKPRPIVPVPADAPPMDYQHPRRGAPSKAWAYHDAGGQAVGYVLRWDFTGNDGKPDKDILPVCYCDFGDNRRAWRAVGMVTPRPLYRLPDGRLVGREYTARNPTRADMRLGSFRNNVNSGRWADFATGDKGGDVVSLAAYLSGTGQAEAARALADMLGVRHV